MRGRLAAILRRLDDLPHALDLDRDGLGDKLMDVASEVLEHDFDAGVSPDGSAWDELSPAYLAWKERHALTTQKGYLEGELGKSENFRGERVINQLSATLTFGVSELAKQEAGWFNAARPFWGFSAESIDRQKKLLLKRIS